MSAAGRSADIPAEWSKTEQIFLASYRFIERFIIDGFWLAHISSSDNRQTTETLPRIEEPFLREGTHGHNHRDRQERNAHRLARRRHHLWAGRQRHAQWT